MSVLTLLSLQDVTFSLGGCQMRLVSTEHRSAAVPLLRGDSLKGVELGPKGVGLCVCHVVHVSYGLSAVLLLCQRRRMESFTQPHQVETIHARVGLAIQLYPYSNGLGLFCRHAQDVLRGEDLRRDIAKPMIQVDSP